MKLFQHVLNTFFFQIKCVKLKLDNWVTEVFFAGFDLLAWTNLLNLIG